MKAAIYNGKKNILLGELETPKAGEHDIVVKNLYASICGTDVAVYSHGPGTGHRITLGGEFGHEAADRHCHGNAGESCTVDYGCKMEYGFEGGRACP